MWEEDNHRAHTTDDTVDEHRLQRTLWHVYAHLVTQPSHKPFNPVHRILPQGKGGLEHDVQQEEEDGEAEILMRQHTIDEMGGLIGVFFRARLVAGFFKGTVDKAVLGIHDGRLGVAVGLFQHTGGSMVAHG